MANMNLDSLRTNLTNPQRVFLWEFEIPAPKGSGSSDIWVIRAQSIMEPGRNFEPIDINYKGTGGLRVPGRERYSHEFTVRILEGEDSNTFQAIQSWMKLIRDNVTGVGVGDPDLKTNAVLTKLSTKGKPTRRIKLVGMYPQAKPDSALDYDTNDTQKYEVTFSYDRWEEMS